MFTKLLLHDAALVYAIQRALSPLPLLSSLSTLGSSLGDPRYSYTVTFPLVYWLLGPGAGVHVLATAALAEWCNITLKWLLLGDRPFWWVEGREEWPPDHQLLQVPITCETGPGNPSGHVMVTLAVLLASLQNIGTQVYGGQTTLKPLSRHLLKLGVGLLTALVGLSRLYISSHFVHQIFLGFIVGLLIHRLSSQSTSLTSRLRLARGNCADYLCASVGFLVVGVVVYYLWTSLGFDPSFSVQKATRACRNPQWIHLDTTPFYSLVRSSGSVLGLAVVAGWMEGLWNAEPAALGSRISGLVFTYTLIAAISIIPVYSGSGVVFYALSMVKCCLLPLTAIAGKLLLRLQNKAHH